MTGFTLVPSSLFSESAARQILSEVVPLEEAEPLSFVPLPSFDAVLVYSGPRPRAYDMLLSLCKIRDYNKILASLDDGILSLVVAFGEEVAFCNSFPAADFVTAEYYIFCVMRKLQLNPEQSSIFFASPLSLEERLSLGAYFRSAEQLQ